jgi:hypothetical protein
MIKREINRLNQEIGRAEEVVLTHVRHYQQKVGTKEHKEAPENRNRKRRGMPALGAPTDLGSMTGSGREARRQRIDVGPMGGDKPGFHGAMQGARSPEYAPISPPMGFDPMDMAMGDPIQGSPVSPDWWDPLIIRLSTLGALHQGVLTAEMEPKSASKVRVRFGSNECTEGSLWILCSSTSLQYLFTCCFLCALPGQWSFKISLLDA